MDDGRPNQKSYTSLKSQSSSASPFKNVGEWLVHCLGCFRFYKEDGTAGDKNNEFRTCLRGCIQAVWSLIRWPRPYELCTWSLLWRLKMDSFSLLLLSFLVHSQQGALLFYDTAFTTTVYFQPKAQRIVRNREVIQRSREYHLRLGVPAKLNNQIWKRKIMAYPLFPLRSLQLVACDRIWILSVHVPRTTKYSQNKSVETLQRLSC